MTGDKYINISGYTWRDVTNKTYSGIAYDIREVISSGGRVPEDKHYYSD